MRSRKFGGNSCPAKCSFSDRNKHEESDRFLNPDNRHNSLFAKLKQCIRFDKAASENVAQRNAEVGNVELAGAVLSATYAFVPAGKRDSSVITAASQTYFAMIAYRTKISLLIDLQTDADSGATAKYFYIENAFLPGASVVLNKNNFSGCQNAHQVPSTLQFFHSVQ